MSSGGGYRSIDRQKLSSANELKLVKSGNDFFKRAVDIIHRSHKSIHFQTYIFIDDHTGKMVLQALEQAAKRGVKVFLLVDAFGSYDLSHHAIVEMKKHGIHFRFFSPIIHKHHISFGRRLHHKIVLGDNKEALIGGINVEDKYHIDGPGTPWLDYAVYVKGNVCKQIAYICEVLWKGQAYKMKKRKFFHVLDTLAEEEENIPVIVRQNDWLFKKEGISLSLRKAIRHSHSSITLMASYFLPGGRIRKLLRKASDRNVKIKVIFQGLSDVTLAKKATTYLYAWMLRNNIEIYEWDNTILHGKMTLVDDKWASIGSYNINHLSDYSSIETNLEIHDSAFCETVKKELDNVISHCHRITDSEYHEQMNVWQQFTCWFAFYFTRFLFRLQYVLVSKE
jgi:cardiolipin synthase